MRVLLNTRQFKKVIRDCLCPLHDPWKPMVKDDYRLVWVCPSELCGFIVSEEVRREKIAEYASYTVTAP